MSVLSHAEVGGLTLLGTYLLRNLPSMAIEWFRSKQGGVSVNVGQSKNSGNGNNGHDKISREECNRIHNLLNEKLTASEKHFEKADQKLETIMTGMGQLRETMSFISGKLERKAHG